MANEITIVSKLKVTKGNLARDTGTITVQITQSGIGAFGGTLSIGTADEAVTFTDIGTLGVLWMRNLDATNYVEWGPDSAGAIVPVGKMKPGETAGPFRLKPGITFRLQANTGACKVDFIVTED